VESNIYKWNNHVFFVEVIEPRSARMVNGIKLLTHLVFILLFSRVWSQNDFVAQKIQSVKQHVDKLLEKAKTSIASKKVSLNARIEDSKKRAASSASMSPNVTLAPGIDTKQLHNIIPPGHTSGADHQSSSSTGKSVSSTSIVEPNVDGTSHRMQKVLDAHQISSSLHQTIVGMSQSNIPRETIVEQLYNNYLPDGKTAADANDIVVAANLARGYELPRASDTKHANAVKAAENLQKFQKAKEEFARMMS
jgi:hypothetical protein